MGCTFLFLFWGGGGWAFSSLISLYFKSLHVRFTVEYSKYQAGSEMQLFCSSKISLVITLVFPVKIVIHIDYIKYFYVSREIYQSFREITVNKKSHEKCS